MTEALKTLDRFFSTRLGASLADLKPGQTAVTTCVRRTYAERSFGFIRLLWVMHFGDLAVVSVHPAALSEVARLAWRLKPEETLADEFVEKAAQALATALPGLEGKAGGGSVILYHPGEAPIFGCDGVIRTLVPSDQERWAGSEKHWSAANHPCAERGEAFGAVGGEKVVGEVMTHEPPVAEMEYQVAEDGIDVADGYRGEGFGKALLSVWTRDMQAKGRVAVHSTSLNNAASYALARSVGYIEYARTRVVTWHEPE